MLVVGRKVVATRRRCAAVLAALLAAEELRWPILNAVMGETRDARIVAAVANFILFVVLFYESSISELWTTCVIVGADFLMMMMRWRGYFLSTGTKPLSL